MAFGSGFEAANQARANLKPQQSSAKARFNTTPELGDLYLATAYAARRFRSIDQAKAVLLAGEPLLKEQAIFHFKLACCECQLGNLDAAKERLTKAFKIDHAFKAVALDDRDLEPLWGSLAFEWQ
jgi:tetratricopeptide (TPR) repeat protein